MTVLLDVNLLVALSWREHVLHQASQEWFANLEEGWATSTTTESGFMRISMNPHVTSSPVSWGAALDMLADHHHGRLATLDHGVAEALHPDDRDLVALVRPR